jgi:hypothetical protein
MTLTTNESPKAVWDREIARKALAESVVALSDDGVRQSALSRIETKRFQGEGQQDTSKLKRCELYVVVVSIEHQALRIRSRVNVLSKEIPLVNRRVTEA